MKVKGLLVRKKSPRKLASTQTQTYIIIWSDLSIFLKSGGRTDCYVRPSVRQQLGVWRIFNLFIPSNVQPTFQKVKTSGRLIDSWFIHSSWQYQWSMIGWEKDVLCLLDQRRMRLFIRNLTWNLVQTIPHLQAIYKNHEAQCKVATYYNYGCLVMLDYRRV